MKYFLKITDIQSLRKTVIIAIKRDTFAQDYEYNKWYKSAVFDIFTNALCEITCYRTLLDLKSSIRKEFYYEQMNKSQTSDTENLVVRNIIKYYHQQTLKSQLTYKKDLLKKLS